jgi:hypothetical protein
MTDQERVISTLRLAGQIIGEYLEPGPRDAEETLARLIALLDSQDLARAIERLEKVQGLRGGELKSHRHSNRYDPPPE